MRWEDRGTASFLVEAGYIVGTVSMMEDRTWAWSAWEADNNRGTPPRARGRAESKLNAQQAVKAALHDA